MKSYFILYVQDQERARAFYAAALGVQARLHVLGMTEFELPGGGVLGLMPEEGIKKLLGNKLPDPATARGTPRSELYLVVEEPERHHSKALQAGGIELSALQERSWGHVAAYCLDPDGHVLAFASSPAAKDSAV